MLYKKVLLIGPASQSHFQRNVTKKYFPVVLICVSWKVILTLTLAKISEPVAEKSVEIQWNVTEE